MNTAYRVSSTLDATARPPSWGVPRWPTTAVSARTYSGSAMRAPSAGTARAAISRSCGLRSHRRAAVVGSVMSRSANQSAVAFIDTDDTEGDAESEEGVVNLSDVPTRETIYGPRRPLVVGGRGRQRDRPGARPGHLLGRPGGRAAAAPAGVPAAGRAHVGRHRPAGLHRRPPRRAQPSGARGPPRARRPRVRRAGRRARAHGATGAAVVLHQPHPQLEQAVADALETEELHRSMILAPDAFGTQPPTDGAFYHLAGVPVMNFLTAPFYLFDEMDTLDKVERDNLS